jgi:hypothetical protein
MQNVGIGDVIFIILILGVIHGIMYLVTSARKRNAKSDEEVER